MSKLRYIACNDIGLLIEYSLGAVEDHYHQQCHNITYVNNGLPNSLFKIINKKEYKFKNNKEFMQKFDYHQINNLFELSDYIDTSNYWDLMIIEDFNLLISSTKTNYTNLNDLIISIILKIKKINANTIILDTVYRSFIELNCDQLEILFCSDNKLLSEERTP